MRTSNAVLIDDTGTFLGTIRRGHRDSVWAFDTRCIAGYRWIAGAWRRVVTLSPDAVVGPSVVGTEWRVYPGGTTPPMTIDLPDPDR